MCFAYLLFVYIFKVCWPDSVCAVRLSRFRVRLRLKFSQNTPPTPPSSCLWVPTHNLLNEILPFRVSSVFLLLCRYWQGRTLWIIGNVRSCIFNECLSCFERSDLGETVVFVWGASVWMPAVKQCGFQSSKCCDWNRNSGATLSWQNTFFSQTLIHRANQ